jgi:integrase
MKSNNSSRLLVINVLKPNDFSGFLVFPLTRHRTRLRSQSSIQLTIVRRVTSNSYASCFIDRLEIYKAALLLEVTRRYRPAREDVAIPFAYQLIGTMLLTGGRMSEVLGLEVTDISIERRTVTFRPNQWRRLKLEEILVPYLLEEHGPQGSLLFPSYRTGQETMLTDIRKVLDQIGKREGWAAGEIHSKQFQEQLREQLVAITK